MILTLLNWGILGTGKIANEFAGQFKVDRANLYAIASRTQKRSEAFASQYNIKKAYDSYEELLNDKNIDVVYIATPHSHHYEHIMKSLQSNKHVVCEKSITISKSQLDEAIKLAKQNNLYLFEAMTIHYMPLYKQIIDWVNSNDLGALKMIQVNFGSYKDTNPEFYYFNKELAGGSLLDIGVYALNFVRWFLSSKPKEIFTLGNLHKSGVDESAAIILRNKEKELATISLTFRSKMPKQGIVAYENGYFTIFNYPRTDYATFTTSDGKVQKFNVGNTNKALTYEISEITDILLNQRENPYIQYTLDVLEIMDYVRNQWGLEYPFENR
ncbi:Gfo/Idh/MocA family protein [Amphibacillus sp. Q70]|uniref:Gfo/Idh/MocA family protein n=1 Tax=Amphibacillus sp. Q70 TaxID=3453416 RepID=UPI003F84969C